MGSFSGGRRLGRYSHFIQRRRLTNSFFPFSSVRHIEYCMHRVNLLRHYGLKPILVFDGGLLPMKGEQENKRARYCMFPGFSISLGFFFFFY